MLPRRVTRSTAKAAENIVNQTAQQSVASMFVRPTKRSIAELDDEAAPVKPQKELKRARKANTIPENQTQSSSMIQNSASTQSYAEDVAIAAPRGRGRRKADIQQTRAAPPKTAAKGRGKKAQCENEKPEAIELKEESMPVEKAKKGKRAQSVDDALAEQAKAALPKTPAKGRGKIEMEEPEAIEPEAEQAKVALPKTPGEGNGKKSQVEIEEPEAIEPEAEQAKVAFPKTPAKGHGKKVHFEIEEPEAIEPEAERAKVAVPKTPAKEPEAIEPEEQPMATEKTKGGKGKKAQFIDNALAEEQMAQVPTKARGKKATATQAQSAPSNTRRVTRSKTAANKPGEKNENKATNEEQMNAFNEQPAMAHNRGRKAKVTKAVQPDADQMEVIEEEPKPFAEPELIITPSNQVEKEPLSKTPRSKRAAARNAQRAATPATRRSTRAKKEAVANQPIAPEAVPSNPTHDGGSLVEQFGDEEEAFAARKKPLRHKAEPTQKVTKTRGKAKGRQGNKRKQMNEELTQAQALKEQDAMEGIGETPFIDKQIEEQDAMEGIEETPFINKQITEQDQVAQAEVGDTVMLEGEYPSVLNIAEEPVKQISSLAALECPESPELEMSDVDENEGELEAVPIANTTSSPHTTGDLENPLDSPILSSPTRTAPIPSTPLATGRLSVIAAQLSHESVVYTPKPKMNQLDISSSPTLPPYTLIGEEERSGKSSKNATPMDSLDPISARNLFGAKSPRLTNDSPNRTSSGASPIKRLSISFGDYVATPEVPGDEPDSELPIEIDTGEDDNAISTHGDKIIGAGEEESSGIQDHTLQEMIEMGARVDPGGPSATAFGANLKETGFTEGSKMDFSLLGAQARRGEESDNDISAMMRRFADGFSESSKMDFSLLCAQARRDDESEIDVSAMLRRFAEEDAAERGEDMLPEFLTSPNIYTPTTRAENESAAATTLDSVAPPRKFSDDDEEGIENEIRENSERIQATPWNALTMTSLASAGKIAELGFSPQLTSTPKREATEMVTNSLLARIKAEEVVFDDDFSYMEEEAALETATPSNNTPHKNAPFAEKVASPLLARIKAEDFSFDDEFSYMEEEAASGVEVVA